MTTRTCPKCGGSMVQRRRGEPVDVGDVEASNSNDMYTRRRIYERGMHSTRLDCWERNKDKQTRKDEILWQL